MIASSGIAKSIAFTAAIVLHAALLWEYAPKTTEIATEGARGALETRLGDSFEDMSKGVLSPVETETTALSPELPSTAQQVFPTTAMSAPAVKALPAEAIAAQPIEDTAVVKSPRPAQRPKALETEPKPTPKASKKTKPKTGASKESRKGAQSGKAKAAQAPKSTGASPTQTTGNAAAQNYPGKVMRKISRVPKPRVASKGSATVRFTISFEGGLAAATIAKSSGSSELDRAALKVVASAAHFPKPPAGAQRSFTLKISGK